MEIYNPPKSDNSILLTKKKRLVTVILVQTGMVFFSFALLVSPFYFIWMTSLGKAPAQESPVYIRVFVYTFFTFATIAIAFIGLSRRRKYGYFLAIAFLLYFLILNIHGVYIDGFNVDSVVIGDGPLEPKNAGELAVLSFLK